MIGSLNVPGVTLNDLGSKKIILDCVNGNDATADGSESRPYLTLDAAVKDWGRIRKGGNTTFSFKAGTYSISSTCYLHNIGFCYFSPFSGQKDVTIRYEGSGGYGLYFQGLHYVTIHNIIFDGASSNAVGCIFLGGNIDIRRSEFKNWKVAIEATRGCAGETNSNTFENISDCAFYCGSGATISSILNSAVSNVYRAYIANSGIVTSDGVLKGSVTNATTNGGQIF